MTNEHKKGSIFFDIFLFLVALILGAVFASLIALMILFFVHLFLTERPPFLQNKMWRGMFFQEINWTVAAIIWSIVFIAFEISIFGSVLKRRAKKKTGGNQ